MQCHRQQHGVVAEEQETSREAHLDVPAPQNIAGGRPEIIDDAPPVPDATRSVAPARDPTSMRRLLPFSPSLALSLSEGRSQPMERDDDVQPAANAPPIPPAQIDANLHEEKIRSQSIYPANGTASNNAHVFGSDDAGQGQAASGAVRVGDAGEVADENPTTVVHRCKRVNSSQPGTATSSGREEMAVGAVRVGPPSSMIVNPARSNNADPEAMTAVVQPGEEVVVAQRVGRFERRWRPLALVMCVLLVIVVVGLALTLSGVINVMGEEEDAMLLAEEEPQTTTSLPSSSPSFVPRPTLEVVQERGYIRCGLRNEVIISGRGFHLNLCRAAAAVIFGNPDKFEGVPLNWANRWQNLLDRTVDLVILGDTHTIEREVKESSTGSGFTFSTVFNYDGMVYLGNQTFVRCAEEQKRYDECSSLMTCVEGATTHYDFLNTAFPSDYIKVGLSLKEITDMLLNGTCNVLTIEKSFLQHADSLNDGILDGRFVLGTEVKTKEPHGVITRDTDREFSDIINRVIQTLFLGEEQGLTKTLKNCKEYTHLTLYEVSDLDFWNAIYCVGNYGEIFDGDPDNRGMNQINKGTGMLYAIPFGNLDEDAVVHTTSTGTLAKIRTEGLLKCGVIDTDVSKVNIGNMGKDYCRILAAALLNGDPKDVTFVPTGSKLNSYMTLNNGDVDVLVGDGDPRRFDLKRSSQLAGSHFSIPYYYGASSNYGDVSFYSMATREDDVLFSSFVNCVVLATIYAQENKIQREKSSEMPLVSVFGSHLNWALRDAIVYSGSYDQIYMRNFVGNLPEASRGRNDLNEGGPLMLSIPFA